MNEQEKEIILETIKSIKALVSIAMQEIADNICSSVDKKYNRFNYVLDLGEDTIKELEKLSSGQYGEPKEGLCRKGE